MHILKKKKIGRRKRDELRERNDCFKHSFMYLYICVHIERKHDITKIYTYIKTFDFNKKEIKANKLG